MAAVLVAVAAGGSASAQPIAFRQSWEGTIDFFATNRAGNQAMFTSPLLAAGTHTFRLRVTGTRNAGSSNTFVVPDRVDISG